MTEYRIISGFPAYRVGSDGSVWRGQHQIRAYRHKAGYRRVALLRDGKTCFRLVHNLVLEAFVGPCPPGMEACHYPDHDKANNHLENLRWDTHAENMKDAYRDRPPAHEKKCRRCGDTKPVSEFYRDGRASDGLKGECKPCANRVTLETSDKEKRRKANREYWRRTQRKVRNHA